MEKHLLPSFAIVQLDGVQTWKSIQPLHKVKMKWMKSLHIIAMTVHLAGTKTPKESLRSTLL